MIGQQIQQFRIVEKIGEGGMGEVYLAEDTRLERMVALKFLPPHYSQDRDFKARFEHEAKATAALNHPNIVTVYELGEHEGRLYIAMEHVQGHTLETLIKQDSLNVDQAISVASRHPGLDQSIKIVQQMCEGLCAAHEAGVVHRDIKPANVLVTKDGRVKLLDFGLAKSRRATTTTQVGTTVGTIQYESPEQGRGAEVDQRSDLFSLGVVFYEMITSQRPFKGEFEDAIRYAIANENPEPLARYKADVPDDIQRIVTKLLEKDPELRYQSAAGVLSDLKTLQRDSGPHASGVHSAMHSTAHSAVQPAAPAKKGMGRILIPAGLVVVVLALLFVFKPWNIAIQPTQEASAAVDRLAVMYFDNFNDPVDAGRQGEIVTNLLISDFSESEHVQVVSSQRLYDLLKQLGKEGTRVITPDVATQVAQKANAKWMLTGSIMESAPNWVVSAQLSEVTTGDILASPTIEGRPGERIYDVVDRLTAEIKQDLSIPVDLADADRPVEQLTTTSTEAYRLFLEAKELNNQYRYIAAEEKYREAIAIDSTFAMAYEGLVMVRMAGWRDYFGALELIEKAKRHSDHATAKDRLFIEAWDHSLNDRGHDAEQTYLRLIERYPDEKEAYRRLAGLYRLNQAVQDLPRSIEMFEKTIELDPLYAEAYNGLAYSADMLGNYEKSIWAIDKYIELEPDQPNPYDSRGELLANSGQPELSLASYLKAIEIDSNFVSAYRGAVAMSVFLGRYDQAEAICRPLLTHPSQDLRSSSRRWWTDIAVHQGQFKEAAQRLEEAERLDLEDFGKSMNLMVTQSAQANLHSFTESVASMRQSAARGHRTAEAIDPSGLASMFAHLATVIWEARAGALERSDSLLRMVEAMEIEMFPDSSFIWTAYAVNAHAGGDAESSLKYSQLASGDHPDFGARYLLGQGFADAGRLRDAVRLYESARDTYDQSRWGLMFESVLVHYHLGVVYEKSGRSDKAREEYEAFLAIWGTADTELDQIQDARRRLADLQT